jgi:hypothetical protein
MAIGRTDYEERREMKIETYQERAAKSNDLANQELNRARDMGSVIPLGQPILVGHHSEKPHRALLKKIDSAYQKAHEAGEKATYYQAKANSAEDNKAISGDDTEAVNRYNEKLKELEAAQERMKAINKAWKQGNAALNALGLTDDEIEKIKNKMPDYETKPFPTWALSNNNAEIRRIKQKLEELNKLDTMKAETVKFPGGEAVINLELNRIQFLFDDIPSQEIRKLLKSNGFKWSPKEKAWQRQRTLNAVRTIKYLLKEHFNK